MSGGGDPSGRETGMDPRLFRVTPETYYVTGSMCEQLVGVHRGMNIRGAFVHFKWCKPLYSITKAWPGNWPDLERFRRILREKALPGDGIEHEMDDEVWKITQAVL